MDKPKLLEENKPVLCTNHLVAVQRAFEDEVDEFKGN